MAVAMVADAQIWDGYEAEASAPAAPVRRSPDRGPSSRVFRRRRAAAATLVMFSVLAAGWALSHGAPLRQGTAGGAAGGGPLTAAGSPTMGAGSSTLVLRAAGSSAVVSARTASAQVWVVRPGDTVWSIVEDAGYAGDPRPVVDRIEAQLGDHALRPGERLVLP
jgi:hypothetical protein